jgi:hypothetical protein
VTRNTGATYLSLLAQSAMDSLFGKPNIRIQRRASARLLEWIIGRQTFADAMLVTS